MDFEWDEVKRRSNVAKHGIDFADAVAALRDGAALVYRSSVPTADSEERHVAIAKIQEKYIAIVFTRRGDTIRIISARRARREERRRYDQAAR